MPASVAAVLSQPTTAAAAAAAANTTENSAQNATDDGGRDERLPVCAHTRAACLSRNALTNTQKSCVASNKRRGQHEPEEQQRIVVVDGLLLLLLAASELKNALQVATRVERSWFAKPTATKQRTFHTTSAN